MTKRLHLYFILALLPLLGGCSAGCQQPDKRSDSETRQLRQAIDSVDALSPGAPRLIDSLLASAPDSLTYYEYYALKGRLFLHSEHPDSSLAYYQCAARFAERQAPTPRINGLLATVYNSQAGYNHLMRQNNDATIALYKQALQLSARSDVTDFMPEIAANLGDAYIQCDDLPQGANYYRRALFLVDSLHLPECKNITLYMGLGQIYTTLHDYDTALHYYALTDQLFSQMTPAMQDYFLNNYGNCYYFMKDYAKARDMFMRMKSHIEQYGGTGSFDMFLCQINLADVYLNLGMTDSATHYVDCAEPFFREHHVDEGVCYANTIRIGIALREGRLADVGTLLAQTGDKVHLEYNLMAVRNGYLSEYFERTGQYRQAYENLKEGITQRDSAEHNRQHMRAAEIMMRLQQDTLQLHHQLAVEEHHAYVSRARSVLWALLAAIACLALGFYAYVSRAHKRRMQDSMDVMRLKLANARNRISPHFIFNVLNHNIESEQGRTEQLNQLSTLIRQNLDLTNRAYVSLKEEMDFVRRYLDVETPMLMPDFQYTIDMPDDQVAETITVPSMTVQILAENAVVHALKGKTGPKRLAVRAVHDEQKTVITVTDNGAGFDIRHREGRNTKNGLKIITHTIQITNLHNKPAEHMHFDIRNIGKDGQVQGCEATLTIPNHINYV